jgi:hypothetical protein
MKYIDKDLVMMIREKYLIDKVDILENIGYELDNELSNEHTSVYIDKRINSVVTIVTGLDLNIFFEKSSFENLNLIHIIHHKIKVSEECIDKVCEKYNNYNLIFLGHSLGGLVINLTLNNTNHKCYTYNPCFVNTKRVDNIKNYRTNGDILSISLIGNETKTIDIDFIEYFIKQKGNLFDFLKEVHETTIFTKFDNLYIHIPIPMFDESIL